MQLTIRRSIVLSLCAMNAAMAQTLTPDVPYVKDGHERQVLDIYAPAQNPATDLPVMFWIHGGGWQVGDKDNVALKPKAMTERGFVFVSTNYRLLPDITMEDLVADVAAIAQNVFHASEFLGLWVEFQNPTVERNAFAYLGQFFVQDRHRFAQKR